LLLAVVAAAFVGMGVLAFIDNAPAGGDTAVYQAGAATLLDGQPIYDADSLAREPDYAKLPFTYAPFATVMFIPLIVFPPQVAWGILNAISVLATVLVVYLVLSRVPRRPAWLSPGWGSVLITLPLLASEPLRVTLEYGQINAVLMALVAVDVLVLKGRKYSGVLIGIAAAVKLVPLIFVVHLLLTGRKADAARAAGTFAGLQLLMLLIAPHDTARFWTHTVFDSSRIGPTEWVWNQSLGGMVRRFTESAPWSQPVAYALGAALAAGAMVLIRRFHRRDRPVYAMLVTVFLGLLVSPVSWLHHWVWIVPLIAMLLAAAGCGNRIAQWLLPVTVLLFTVPVMRLVTHGQGREYDWGPIEVLAGNSWVLFPVIVGVLLLSQPESREFAQVK
jgi:alpha-1,2-mannosyltransferase